MSSAEQFETIVSEHYEALYRFAANLTRSRSDAQDLVQQTFYVWATKGHQLRDLSKVKTWLFTTLHRLFLKARRRENAQHQESLPEIQAIGVEFNPGSPEDDLIEWHHVLNALGRVDQPYQASLIFFFLKAWPQKQIAQVLDVPIGTVKSRLSRGIAQLREILRADQTVAFSSVDRT